MTIVSLCSPLPMLLMAHKTVGTYDVINIFIYMVTAFFNNFSMHLLGFGNLRNLLVQFSYKKSNSTVNCCVLELKSYKLIEEIKEIID